MKYENHERHEIHGTHEAHGNRHSPEQRGPRKPFRLRIESPLDAETEAVITRTIGCAIAVHTALGPGFLESIYKRAMRIELDAQRLPYECERAVSVAYRGVEIRGQRIDLIVENRVVVELKAVTRLDPIHEAQTISYLRTTKLRAALLINFRVPLLPQGLRRIVL
jgi:GxxExxY protein